MERGAKCNELGTLFRVAKFKPVKPTIWNLLTLANYASKAAEELPLCEVGDVCSATLLTNNLGSNIRMRR